MTTLPPGRPDTLAAVDLGSNSFHLFVARVDGDALLVVDKVKEKVQLAAGLGPSGLSDAAFARGLDCLNRFAQLLRGIDPARVRAVGTSALRQAANRDEFIAEASRVLGVPIDVIAGEEEASLIFLGVAQALADDGSRRLVIDIGGASTELAIGTGFVPDEVVSVQVGCVTLGELCFERDSHTGRAFSAAEAIARERLAPHAAALRQAGWSSVAGSSGTIESVLEVLQANGLADDCITRDGVEELRTRLRQRILPVDLGLSGLAPDRADIFPAGFAIVSALFDLLGIERMEYAEGDLKDGLIARILGGRPHRDVRERSVLEAQRRFGADLVVSGRVAAIAAQLFEPLAAGWGIDVPRSRELLQHAAQIHQIGLVVSPHHPERHGAYLVSNGAVTGFSRRDRQELALLVRGYRRSFPRMALAALPEPRRQVLSRLVVLLRLAVLLARAWDADGRVPASLTADEKRLQAHVDGDWLVANPLTLEELEREVDLLAAAGYELEIVLD